MHRLDSEPSSYAIAIIVLFSEKKKSVKEVFMVTTEIRVLSDSK